MTVLPVTLAAAAAAAVLNIWLGIRIGALRTALQISVGDGGSEALQRRMRAQLNYVENTGFVLVLIAAIELAGRGSWWLAYVAAAYFLGRIAHGFELAPCGASGFGGGLGCGLGQRFFSRRRFHHGLGGRLGGGLHGLLFKGGHGQAW